MHDQWRQDTHQQKNCMQLLMPVLTTDTLPATKELCTYVEARTETGNRGHLCRPSFSNNFTEMDQNVKWDISELLSTLFDVTAEKGIQFCNMMAENDYQKVRDFCEIGMFTMQEIIKCSATESLNLCPCCYHQGNVWFHKQALCQTLPRITLKMMRLLLPMMIGFRLCSNIDAAQQWKSTGTNIWRKCCWSLMQC